MNRGKACPTRLHAPSEDSDQLAHPYSSSNVGHYVGSQGYKVSSSGERRLGSDAQADHSLLCPPEDVFGPWLRTQFPAKALVKMCGCGD